MRLVLGGIAQGKRDYVKTAYQISENDIFSGEQTELEQLCGAKALDKFHLWVKRKVKEQADVPKLTDIFIEKNPDCIVICDGKRRERIPGAGRKNAGHSGRIFGECGACDMRNSTENKITMIFIRHGETASNRKKSYLGWTDEPLSEKGCEMLAHNRGNYPVADIIFTSPMTRCRQTKEILYKGQPYQTIEKWKEMNFGSFEGKTYLDLKGNADYQRWIDSGGTLPFPGGESRAEFIARCRAGLIDCLMKSGKQKKVVCIVHGGTIMALFDSYGKGSYFDYQCRCGQGYECTLTYALDETGVIEETSISMTDEKLITGE